VTELVLNLGGREMPTSIETAIVAGWTGRDRRALEEHMAELEKLGVARPSAAPIFYRVSASRLTTREEIESTGASSGEVEAVLLRAHGSLWVGVGSDHTDREVESYDVAVSKQMCDKPIAAEFWPYDDVATHWDSLTLRSRIVEDGSEALYQEGSLAAMLGPDELLDSAEPTLSEGSIMFCGTLAARGGLRPAPEFRYELEDPVLGRRISGRYAVRPLPLVS
jgi:Protein of unknown function (DUF2848)